MASLVRRDSQESVEQWVSRVKSDQPFPEALLVLLALEVRPDRQGRRAHPGPLAHLASLTRSAHKALLGPLAPADRPGLRAVGAQTGQQVTKGIRETLAQLGLRGQWARPDQRGKTDTSDPRGPPVLEVMRDRPD